MRYAQSLLITMLTSFTALAQAAAPMSLTSNQSSIVMRSDGSAMATYTLTNNANVALQGITIDPAYHGGNPSQMSLQNNNCSGVALSSLASCTFQILIQGAQQTSTFVLSPRACANNGSVCATAASEYRIPVVVEKIPSTQAINAYVALFDGSDQNTLQPINTANNSLGTVIPGFNFQSVVSKSSVQSRSSLKGCRASKSISPAPNPISTAISTDGKTLYVGNYENLGTAEKSPILGRLSIVDVSANPGKIIKNIEMESVLVSVALSPNGTTVYTGMFNRTVNVVQNGIVVSTILLPPFLKTNNLDSPIYVAVNPSGTTLFISDQSNGVIYVYNTNDLSAPVETVIAGGLSQKTIFSPRVMTVSPDGTTLYVTTDDTSILAFSAVAPYNLIYSMTLPSMTNLKSLPTMGNGLVVSPNGSRLYVAMTPSDGCTGYIAVIDTQSFSLLSMISDMSPVGVSLTPNGQYLYVTNTNGTAVQMIDLNTNVVTDIPLSGDTNNYGAFLG